MLLRFPLFLLAAHFLHFPQQRPQRPKLILWSNQPEYRHKQPQRIDTREPDRDKHEDAEAQEEYNDGQHQEEGRAQCG